MSHKVVVTGTGCISGLGAGVAPSWQRMVDGDGAIRPMSREAWKGEPDFLLEGVAAWIAPEDVAAAMPDRELRKLGMLDPFSKFALIAADEAVRQAGLDGHPCLDERTAVLIGCGSSGNSTADSAFERLYIRRASKAHPQTIPMSMVSAPASHVGMMLGIHGPSFVLSSACASSAHALGEAMWMIRNGRADVVIAGGTEACITLGSWFAWKSLGVMAPDTCRPFSRDRQGMVLGEGAAMLVLESEAHARARGATILGEIAGYGTTSDAGQMTAPDPLRIESAIRKALEDAGTDPSQPALISTHGTGTTLNDVCETTALRAVYGDRIDRNVVLATKSAHGHLIGASAAMQMIMGLRALAEGVAPPVLNHLGPDPDCDLPLALGRTAIDHELVISNSLAFGGLNVVLVGRKAA